MLFQNTLRDGNYIIVFYRHYRHASMIQLLAEEINDVMLLSPTTRKHPSVYVKNSDVHINAHHSIDWEKFPLIYYRWGNQKTNHFYKLRCFSEK